MIVVRATGCATRSPEGSKPSIAALLPRNPHDAVRILVTSRPHPGIPDDVLRPETTWPSEDEYWARYRELATRYIGNFRKFAPECPIELVRAGPQLEREPV